MTRPHLRITEEQRNDLNDPDDGRHQGNSELFPLLREVAKGTLNVHREVSPLA
jgi:hypothetical protein